MRLQTIGVTEHAFDINLGGTNYNWLLYDVGGAVRACLLALPSRALSSDRDLVTHSGDRQVSILRFSRCGRSEGERMQLLTVDGGICFGQRHAWVPFFDDGKWPSLSRSVFCVPLFAVRGAWLGAIGSSSDWAGGQRSESEWLRCDGRTAA